MSQHTSQFAPIVTQDKIDAGIRAAHRQRSEAFWAFFSPVRNVLSRVFDRNRPRNAETVSLRLVVNG